MARAASRWVHAVWILALIAPAAPAAESGQGGAAKADSARPGPPMQLIWNKHVGRCLEIQPLLLSDRIILISTDQKVQCLWLANGKRTWARGLREPASAAPVAAEDPADGILLADGLRRGHLHAWDLKKGKERWIQEIRTPAVQLITRGDRLWALERGGRVTCRSVKDGKEIWKITFGGWDPAGFALEESLLVVLARQDSLICLDPKDGHTRWAARPGGRFSGAPVFRNATVAAASLDGTLFVLDRATGTLRARQSRRPQQLAGPAACGARVVTVSSGGVVEATGENDSVTPWTVDLAEGVQAPPVAYGSLVLVAGGIGTLHALHQERGEEAWALTTHGGFRVAPVVSPSCLCLATDRGEVYVYARGM